MNCPSGRWRGLAWISSILLIGGFGADATAPSSEPLLTQGTYASAVGDFTLHLTAQYPEVAATDLRHMTEDLSLMLVTRFGPVDRAPFRVVVTVNRDQLDEWAGRELSPWIHAVALEYPSRIVLLEPAADGARATPDGFQEALLHELTHIYLHRLYPSRTGGPLPGWFHEGLAVHTSGGMNRSMHRALVRARLFRRFITLEQLRRIVHTSAGLSELAYAQSVVAVQFMDDLYGPGIFRSLFVGLRAGDSFRSAFASAAGESLDVFQTRYQVELLQRYNLLLIAADPNVLFILLPLLVIIAYFTKRWRGRLITAKWKEEDARGVEEVPRDHGD